MQGQEPYLDVLRALFSTLACCQGLVLDLGLDTAGDATVLSARPNRAAKAVRAEVKGCRRPGLRH